MHVSYTLLIVHILQTVQAHTLLRQSTRREELGEAGNIQGTRTQGLDGHWTLYMRGRQKDRES